MTGGTAYYRLGQVELNQAKAAVEVETFKTEISSDLTRRRDIVDTRLQGVENALRDPRYTLADDEARMKSYDELLRRELDRRQTWMEEQTKFRLQMVEFATETRAATKELRGLVEDLKKSIIPK
jgi:hypothetical protein